MPAPTTQTSVVQSPVRGGWSDTGRSIQNEVVEPESLGMVGPLEMIRIEQEASNRSATAPSKPGSRFGRRRRVYESEWRLFRKSSNCHPSSKSSSAQQE